MHELYKIRRAVTPQLLYEDAVSAARNSGLSVQGDQSIKHGNDTVSLVTAAREGMITTTESLLSSPSEQFDSNELGKALFGASLYGHVPVVLALLRAKADPDWIDASDNRTAIWQASAMGHFNVVRALLDARANPLLERDMTRSNPLPMTAWWGHLDILKLLVDAGVDPNSTHDVSKTGPDYDGSEPAIKSAAEQGHVDVCSYLIEVGADPNKPKVDDQETALHEAASQGHPAVISALISGNANPNQLNAAGQTPLDIAISAGHEDCAILLRSGT